MDTPDSLTPRERKAIAARKWAAKNKDRINAKRRNRSPEQKAKNAASTKAWREAHPEAVAQHNRNYYAKNTEEFKAYRKAYYAANKEKLAAAHKAWRAANKEAEYAKRQARRRTHPERLMLIGVRKAAKAQGLPFDLVEADIVIPTHCPVLGMAFECASGYRTDASPSVDRIIPSRGYVRGNILVVSWRANRIKNDSTPAELAKLAVYYASLLDTAPTE